MSDDVETFCSAVIGDGLGRIYGLLKASDESDARYLARVKSALDSQPCVFNRSTLDYYLRVKCLVDQYVLVDYDGMGELLLLVPADKINLVKYMLWEYAPIGIDIWLEEIVPTLEIKLLNLHGTPRLNCKGELL